jgi:hypothetical protein
MLIDTIAIIVAVLLALPLAMLGVECWLSLLPLRRQRLLRNPGMPFRFSVVIPAHDEAEHIANAVLRIKEQIPNDAQVIVVADNCTDATAANALSAGAVVWERNDPERRGKGYALNFAWECLADLRPDVVVASTRLPDLPTSVAGRSKPAIPCTRQATRAGWGTFPRWLSM